jgi:hypothetical protein
MEIISFSFVLTAKWPFNVLAKKAIPFPIILSFSALFVTSRKKREKNSMKCQ